MEQLCVILLSEQEPSRRCRESWAVLYTKCQINTQSAELYAGINFLSDLIKLINMLLFVFVCFMKLKRFRYPTATLVRRET